MNRRIKQILLIITLLAVLSGLVFSLSACSGDKDGAEPAAGPAEEKTIDDFNGCKIGVLTGAIAEMYIKDRLPDAEIFYFSTLADSITALKSGRLDALADDAATCIYFCSDDPSLITLEESLDTFEMNYGVAFPKTKEGAAFRDKFNEFIEEMKADNSLQEICDSWIKQENIDYSLCDYDKLTGENGTIKVATDPNLPPFEFIKDGKIAGLDTTILCLFCKKYGYRLEYLTMDFGAIIASIGTKADFGMSAMTITEERAKSLYFSEPYFTTNMGVTYCSDEVEDKDFIASLKDSFRRTFVEEGRWKLFVSGIKVTLLITVLSLAMGTLIGFLLYLLCYNFGRFWTKLADILSKILNGMPVVVVLMIFYYLIFNKSSLSGIAVAVIVFTLFFATSMYSMMKAGVNAVGAEQEEAAAAMGFTRNQGFLNIILPQAARHFMVRYREEVVTHIKATAIVGYVAVADLTKVSDLVRSRTYEAFFPLIATAIVYFILAELLIILVRWVDFKLDNKNRKPEKILKGVKTDD